MSSSEYESDYLEDKCESAANILTLAEDEVFEPIEDVNLFKNQNNDKMTIRVDDSNNKKRNIYFLGMICLVLTKGTIKFGQRIINHNDLNQTGTIIKFWQSSAKTLKPLIMVSPECELEILNPKLNNVFEQIQCFSRQKFKYLFRDIDVTDPDLNFFDVFQILPPAVVKKYRTYDYKENQEFIKVVDEIHNSSSNQNLCKMTICLGGKNSGKTTFNEMLYELYMNTSSLPLFMDLDPGQQRFGFPGSISTRKFNEMELCTEYGDSLAPIDDNNIEHYMIGSFDCMEYYTNYEEKTLFMIDNAASFSKDVIVNMPGWLTGLGTQFIETIVKRINDLAVFDLKIVYLDDEESFHKLNINIDVDYYITNNSSLYYAPGYKNSVMNTGIFFEQLNWTSGDLREYRLLRSLHDYDNNKSILNQKTFAVSMGNEIKNIRSIKITQYLNKTPSKTEEMTCFKTLPGSIVAISFFDFLSNDILTTENTSIFKDYSNINEKMICLGVVHSVDVKNSYINLIIPLRFKKKIDILNTFDFKYGKIQTMAVGLPYYEFLPVDEDFIKEYKGQIPYTTTRALRKNEHVWKVRKNIQRKGQQ